MNSSQGTPDPKDSRGEQDAAPPQAPDIGEGRTFLDKVAAQLATATAPAPSTDLITSSLDGVKLVAPRTLISEIRRENIRKLIGVERGELTRMSRGLGYKNVAFLSQMVGSNPTRDVSEITARRIEYLYDLPPTSLEDPDFRPRTVASQKVVTRAEFSKVLRGETGVAPELVQRMIPKYPRTETAPEPSSQDVLTIFKDLLSTAGKICAEGGLNPPAPKLIMVLEVCLTDALSTGKVRHDYLRQMLSLAG